MPWDPARRTRTCAIVLLPVAALLAGCSGTSCDRIALPTAADVPALASSEGGAGPVTLALHAVDAVDGQPVANATVRAFWKPGDERSSGSERRLGPGAAYRSAAPGFLLDPGRIYLPANLTVVGLRTDAAGKATLHLPPHQPVGLVYTAALYTEEVTLIGTFGSGDASVELDLFRVAIGGAWAGNWSVAAVDAGQDQRWEAHDIPIGRDAATASARLVRSSLSLEWQDALPVVAHLELAVGANGAPSASWTERLATPPGHHAVAGQLERGFALPPVLQVGPAAGDLQVAPLSGSVPYRVQALLAFARSSHDFQACLAPPPEGRSAAVPAPHAGVAALGLLVAALVVRRAR
ncbi:MAG: hypothetical protein LC623_04150 [Halobacteriales archaeon]|nr:hypothetical protein [Halobacteriales archaeon]